jgi:hypothetical protein
MIIRLFRDEGLDGQVEQILLSEFKLELLYQVPLLLDHFFKYDLTNGFWRVADASEHASNSQPSATGF